MTFEEIKEKYPIGIKLNKTVHIEWRTIPYYNENDLSFYRQTFKEIEIIDKNYCKIKFITEHHDIVAGYLFDGEKWLIVKDTWDGWVPIEIKEDTNV